MTLANEDSPVLNELKKISKILLLTHSAQLDVALGRIAGNDARKKMWVLIDGKRMPKDIANEVGVSLMTVSRFLDSVSAADLVFYVAKRPPHKLLDYVPPEWLNLVFMETNDDKQQINEITPKISDEKDKKKGTQSRLVEVRPEERKNNERQ